MTRNMSSNDEIKRAIEELGSGWELKDDKIIKSFQFPSFMNAIEFVNDVAKIAEKVNHHPIITINWRTVKFSLKSFDVDAITERDINLAKQIEKRQELRNS
ncbi:MAG: 4a-hydroxytetrahydrobiopterin dehydratase [Candidatus Nitrosopolaris sp.]